ncbi:hypothetical protein NEOLEDRAFT_1177008 [Neolentinus lepideus HHB14362 ss-1]|uniref:Uncharacterized protein n=1 Tax=Neolentinus lepideus HHB14362 ss-1 TaxID=1314782 RepID=A0A165TVG9_9AGAM|nr:hypothetical protein NEOLEDRAFT_1177008 [Neolentinus lepideus HHB14362 ss-1]
MAVTQKVGFERLTAQAWPPNLPRASTLTSVRVQPPLQPSNKVPAPLTAFSMITKVAPSLKKSTAATKDSEGETDEEEVNSEEEEEDYREVDDSPSAGAA